MTSPNEMTGHSSSPLGADTRKRTSSAKKWIGVLMLCGLIAAVVAWRIRAHNPPTDKRAAGFGPGEMPPVPVVAGVVAEKDVPIYLEGLGTVQAYNTVTIRARVDGQVVKVAFVEGQDVHAGDLLAQIDPDPYRAALEQALARKGQDEALLANARV